MEMVAWLAGEAHSDQPDCACPVLTAFVRALNDALPDDGLRTRLLRPLVPRLVNSRANASTELARGLAIGDAMVRHFLPMMLRAVGRASVAASLSELAPIDSRAAAASASRVIADLVPAEHALRWMLQRAGDGMAPANFVTAAIRYVREQGSPVLFAACADLADRLARPKAAAVGT
jgi:hypothetical protein